MDFLSIAPGAALVDLILAAMALEAIVLLALRWRFGGGVAPSGLVANLLSGAGLLLALRLVLSGAALAPIAACLLLALAAHVTDLALRWQRAPQKAPARGHDR